MAAIMIETADGPCCPICLELFSIPRQLPCAHSFCEKCLQSHVITEAKKHSNLRYVRCPVCRNSTSPPLKDRPTSEWASMFPVDSVLQSVFPKKSKLARLCDACNAEGAAAQAEGFCPICKEAMCRDCLKFHRKLKISKDHTILSVEELECNQENVLKLAEDCACSEHHGEDIKYYCNDHKVPCCGTCFFYGHNVCSKVIDLKEELPALLDDNKQEEIIADMKKIENHLQTFMETNDPFVNTLEPQINWITDQIREVRMKINTSLDELEKRVKTEGNRIYKEEIIRKQKENHQCLSLIHAVRNSHNLLEAVHKYGSNLQKFLMGIKMRSQLHSYCNLVVEKYEKTDTITLEVEFAPPIRSILSLSLSELWEIATTVSCNFLPLTWLRRPTQNCRVEIGDVIDLEVPTGNEPFYSGVAFLPNDKLLIADDNNSQCILLSSSFQFITSHTLTGKPWNICVLDDQEVAVSLYNKNNIQIMSVVGNVIRPVRTIRTKFRCNAIAPAGKGEIAVIGDCGDNKSKLSVITKRGDLKYCYQYDSTCSFLHCIALNNMKTVVYVTMYKRNSLVCFDMHGGKQFTYSPDNLRGPRGIAVDRYDNIYILGSLHDNIHQLSPDGSIIQVISSGVPKYPCAMGIHKNKNMLVITNRSDGQKIHIYELK